MALFRLAGGAASASALRKPTEEVTGVGRGPHGVDGRAASWLHRGLSWSNTWTVPVCVATCRNCISCLNDKG